MREPARRARPRAGVPLKSWNHCIGLLGLPGTGKSYRALELAREMGKTPAYVVAHDPTGSYRGADIHHYADEKALRARLATRAGGIHVLEVADGGRVLTCGIAIAQASASQAQNGYAVPVLVLWDEMVAVSGASPYRLEDEARDVLARRRHIGAGVGIIWTTQSPQFAHYSLLGLCTELYLFRLQDRRALDRLGNVGVDASILARLPSLPDRQCIRWRPGQRLEPQRDPPARSAGMRK